MAKGKSRKRSARKMTVPVAVVAPIAFGALATYHFAKSSKEQAMAHVTGFDGMGGFHADYLAGMYGPIVGGLVIHKAANKFGLNRAIANAKIPFLRV